MPLYRANDIATLKGAFAALVERFPTQAQAAEVAHRSSSRISRMCDPSETDCYPGIDIVLAMEKEVGAPLVTQHMAARQGCVLTPMEKGSGDVARDFLRLTAGTGRALTDMSEALADGAMSKSDGQIVMADLDMLIELAGQLKRDLMGVGK